ncbi:MAG: hypothetical protein WCQ60_02905 [bacterium]
MEHLTKQQIVLLTLLVSFVTSIATGIVTVALMDQAPVGVTNTINRIIERTIESSPASTDTNQAAVISSSGTDTQSQVSSALASVQKSIIVIKNATGVDVNGNPIGSTTGIGLVVSKSGLVVADKASVALFSSYIGQLPNGTTVPLTIVQSQNNGDLVFLLAQVPADKVKSTVFTPAVLASGLPKLGQVALSLSGADSPTLGQGIVTNVTPASDTAFASFTTSIDFSKMLTAAVYFTPSGQVIGIQPVSGTLYPTGIIKSAIAVQ